MQQLLPIGLTLSLLGVPSLLLAANRLKIDPLSFAFRLGLWFLSVVVIVIAEQGTESWVEQFGLRPFTWNSLGVAAAGTLATLAAWPALQYIQKMLGGVPVEQTKQFQTVIGLSPSYRLFLVATAAIVEEVLYRGYAIGVGQYLLGDMWPAAILSVAIFTLSHFRWGLSHLLSVLWAAIVLTLLFILTKDLLACMLAHAIIDAVGLLIAPAAMNRQRLRANRTFAKNVG